MDCLLLWLARVCRRLNVAITRGRHAVWVVGSAATLCRDESIWSDLVADAKSRKAYVEATDIQALQSKLLTCASTHEQLLQLFASSVWKVCFRAVKPVVYSGPCALGMSYSCGLCELQPKSLHANLAGSAHSQQHNSPANQGVGPMLMHLQSRRLPLRLQHLFSLPAGQVDGYFSSSDYAQGQRKNQEVSPASHLPTGKRKATHRQAPATTAGNNAP